MNWLPALLMAVALAILMIGFAIHEERKHRQKESINRRLMKVLGAQEAQEKPTWRVIE